MTILETDTQLSLRESHKDLTRRRICIAARQCFIEKGADSTSIDEIVGLAGVSRATFYLHYQNKTEVMLDIIRHGESARREIFRKLLDFVEITPQIIRSWMSGYIEAVKSHKHSALRMIEIGRGAHSEAQNILIAYRAAIVEDLGAKYERFRLSGRRSVARERKRVEAVMMIAQLEQFCSCVVIEQPALDLDVGLDVLSERLCAFLQEAAPASDLDKAYEAPTPRRSVEPSRHTGRKSRSAKAL